MSVASEKGLVFELIKPAQILVSYQGEVATDEDWDRYVLFMSSLRSVPKLRFLVWADGSPPKPEVLRRLLEIVRGREWQVAMVSSSPALRFVVSVCSLVNRSIRNFVPSDLGDAC